MNLVLKKIKGLLSIDRRSLAAFRVALAVIVLLDLANRATALQAHYSDSGVLPRVALLEKFSLPLDISFHLASGQTWFQALLFMIAALFALSLLIGYHTRLATIVSWMLIGSLSERNYMVIQGGDVLLSLLFFWSMFLPLGSCWSVDEALNPERAKTPQTFFSAATIALLLQTALVYWMGAVYKFQGLPWMWGNASAVYNALSIDQFSTDLGAWLLQFPEMLRWLTRGSLFIEILGPTLAFLPFKTGPLRSVIVFLMIALHLGFAACLKLGTFPFVSAASWLVFLPPWYWDRLEQRWNRPQHLAFRIFYDEKFPRVRKKIQLLQTFLILPRHLLRPVREFPIIYQEMNPNHAWLALDHRGNRYEGWAAFVYLMKQSPLFWPLAGLLALPPFRFWGEKSLRRWKEKSRETLPGSTWLEERPLHHNSPWFINILVSFLLIYVLAWNLRQSNFKLHEKWFPQKFNGLGNALRLDQSWDMFAPQPTTEDGWYVIPGRLKNGEAIDILTGKAVNWDKPLSVSSQYPSQRWRKYMMNLFSENQKGHRLYFGRYLCRQWNASHPSSQELEQFTINFMDEKTLPPGQTLKIEKRTLWEHSCFQVTAKKTSDDSKKTTENKKPAVETANPKPAIKIVPFNPKK